MRIGILRDRLALFDASQDNLLVGVEHGRALAEEAPGNFLAIKWFHAEVPVPFWVNRA